VAAAGGSQDKSGLTLYI